MSLHTVRPTKLFYLVAWLTTGAVLLAGACSGQVAGEGSGDESPDDESDGPSDEGGSGGTGGIFGNGGDGGNPNPMGDPEVNALACSSSGINPGRAALRRLTNRQYTNTVRDLFAGITTAPEVELPNEVLVGGYDNVAAGQTSSLALLEGYHGAAKTLAGAVANDTAASNKLAPCAAGTNEDTCGETFIRTFGKRVFRRPLTTDEVSRLSAVWKSTRGAYGYKDAVAVTLEAMLLAPQFVFRGEFGAPVSGQSIAQLDSYEIASRLSYFFWDTMPDAALMAAADGDKLKTTAGIEAEAKRMLADPRAKDVVARFHEMWLHLHHLDKMAKDTKTFPQWNDGVKAALRKSVEDYIDHAFWESGKLAAFLTDTKAFVTDETAWIYGPEKVGSKRGLVDLGENRSGILTQAGMLSALAKAQFGSPVHRGMFVIESLLCSGFGAPPNVPAVPDPAPGDPPKTTRQRQEESHSDPACMGCHERIDGIGFALENFDAVGQYRTKENGIDVDASGALVGTRDIDGPFTGAVSLGRKLAVSTQVQQCVATHWFRYGFGRIETEDDHCALKPIVDDFISSKGDMKGLLVTLVTSDAFRYRDVPTP